MTSTQETAVAAAVESLRKAMIAADKSALENLTAAELSYGHSSGRLENKAEFVDALVSGRSGFSAIELSAQTINVQDKVAVVRHVFDATTRKDGGKVKMAILTIWAQQQEKWKLLARQAVRVGAD
jgi:ketosteroid isomerase-like protein